jgi:tRNA (guanine37-N1)-methyltransferase
MLGGFPSDRVLRGISYRDLLVGSLPENVLSRFPRSFDIVGDIALIRLDDDLIVYGGEIAEAIMRIHSIRHIGGERRTTTIYKENGIYFSVDIASMYVNTRLASEGLRVAREIADGSLVLDLFSGYGGFALNIAKIRWAEVVAIDINPYAVEHMRRSIAMNRLRGYVYPIITDSRSPPLRGEFDVVIADNPTNIGSFIEIIEDLLKRGGKAYIYLLAESAEDATNKINTKSSKLEVELCGEVKEYSPKLRIYRCIAHKTL